MMAGRSPSILARDRARTAEARRRALEEGVALTGDSTPAHVQRLAVLDLGSNSFRLVIFTWVPGMWWKRTDEVHEAVRLGQGLEASGVLEPEPMGRALDTVDLFAHFCRAIGVDDVRTVATSAVRDAGNQREFLERVRGLTGLEVRVLAGEQEARYGYLAVINSTTLADGVALDIGGGSMQLVQVARRRALDLRSWPLGAVRMTERFLPDRVTKRKQVRALRKHVGEQLASARWLAGTGARNGRLAGIGGALRNLAAAAQLAAGLPSFGVQGFALTREALGDLIDLLMSLPTAERGRVPGIKPERGDLILASAVVIDVVMEVGGFDAIEVSDAGLREGVLFETLLEDRDPPLFEDVRRASVVNLATQYHADLTHTNHVARLALEMWDALAAAGVHGGGDEERELLWAAAILHDVGMAVDYDDHHKHSRYLILNAGLHGFTPRETALIGQMARYHRKGTPGMREFEPLAERGDEALLNRCAAVLRLAEQLERARDQSVRATRVEVRDGDVELQLEAEEDVRVARWAAEKQRDVFERAFGRGLVVRAPNRDDSKA
jgi:exopolyphosphatase / guanosine-5'-triphosphate,3'-diphosphate pyrophosphatase